MDELAQRFLVWFSKFAAVSLVLLLVAHVLGRMLRSRRNPPQPPASDSPPKLGN